MAVLQGDKAKVTTSIKIDEDILSDAKEWCYMHRTNFSAMVEALVKGVLVKDMERMIKFREETKAILHENLPGLVHDKKERIPKKALQKVAPKKSAKKK